MSESVKNHTGPVGVADIAANLRSQAVFDELSSAWDRLAATEMMHVWERTQLRAPVNAAEVEDVFFQEGGD